MATHTSVLPWYVKTAILILSRPTGILEYTQRTRMLHRHVEEDIFSFYYLSEKIMNVITHNF